MPRPERYSWLRRDGGPLAVSLALHIAVLLLIAPWMVVRSIPEQAIEVEVLLEPAEPSRKRARPDTTARRPVATRPAPSPAKPTPVRTVEVDLQPKPDETRQAPVPDESAGSGRAGTGQPSLAEAAGLSGSLAGAPAPSASADETAGVTALGRTPTPPSPLAPSVGSTPQPSTRQVAPLARPGVDRQEGRLNLAGPAPEARSLEPEFRHAARLGGEESLQGGSRALDAGLSTETGSVNETALQRSRAVPSTSPGSIGRGPALAAVAPRTAGQRSAVVGEGASPVPAKSTEPVAGRSVQPVSRVASGGGLSSAAQAPGSAGTAAPTERGLSPVQGSGGEQAIGRSAVPASRTPSGGGLSTAGQGLGRSGATPPGERGAGLVAAASPGMAGPLPGAAGSAREGEGPGSGERGEGRATLLAGTGTAGRDSGTLQKASGSGSAEAVVDGGQGQLSSSAETQSRAEALSEDRQVAMLAQKPSGQARVVEERFSAVAMRVDSPSTICHLPLMLAGFDRRPIPKGLDTINASQPMVGEVPPRHYPNNLAPGYPLPALPQRAEGRALVRAEIRTDGRVGQLWIKQSSGFPTLDHAAIETVRGWRFYPAERHGMAVAMWMDVPIEYKVPQLGVYR